MEIWTVIAVEAELYLRDDEEMMESAGASHMEVIWIAGTGTIGGTTEMVRIAVVAVTDTNETIIDSAIDRIAEVSHDDGGQF